MKGKVISDCPRPGVGTRALTTKGVPGNDENILKHHRGGGWMTIYICQNSLNYILYIDESYYR